MYAYEADKSLLNSLSTHGQTGITLTCPGFYGPQGRSLRLRGPVGPDFLDIMAAFRFEDLQVTNFEMETAAIYGLAELLGHRALSCNAILANRANGQFSSKPKETVDQLIQVVLEEVASI